MHDDNARIGLIRGPVSISPCILPGMSSDMTIAEFQQMIRERYYATDKARGVPGTFLWFAEEFGELAEALARHERGESNQADLEEEFADVLAWLTTLANIADVDLNTAIKRKYLDGGGPKGTK